MLCYVTLCFCISATVILINCSRSKHSNNKIIIITIIIIIIIIIILIKAAFGKLFNIKTNDKKLLRIVIIATTSSGKLAEKL